MGLEKLVINQITGAAANAFKMSIVIDAMKDKVIDEVAGKVEEKVPVPLPFDTRSVIGGNVPLPANLLTPEVMQTVPEISETQRAELLITLDNLESQLNGLIGTKNSLQGALDTLRTPISTLEKLADTLGKVIPTLKGVVLIIRNLPLPTAVPPGVGLPATVLNNFSNTLDVLKVVIDKIDGPVSVVTDGVEEIVKVITPLLGKLKLLDPIFSQSQQIIIFIRALLLYGPNASQENINEVASDVNGRSTAILDGSPGPLNSSSNGEWRLTSPVDGIGGNGAGGTGGTGGTGGSTGGRDDGNGPPDGVPPTPPSPYTDARGFVYEFFSDDKAYSDFLLGLLTPPVVGDGLIYRGYQLIIENDPSNSFPFPSRRIKATFTLTSSDINPNDPSTNFALRLLGSIIYNLPDEDYSFSSSVQVLISEAYYEIDRFVEGKQSIQNKINAEYIFDSNGVAIGRIPGRPGYTLAPIVSGPASTASGQDGIATTASGQGGITTSDNPTYALAPTISPNAGGSAIDEVNSAGNWFVQRPSSFPRIFRTYINLYKDETYQTKYQGFNIVIEENDGNTTGGGFVGNVASDSQGGAAALTMGNVPRTTPTSSSEISTTPPPNPPPFYPFGVAGNYVGELRGYTINTTPQTYQMYRYETYTITALSSSNNIGSGNVTSYQGGGIGGDFLGNGSVGGPTENTAPANYKWTLISSTVVQASTGSPTGSGELYP